MTMLNSKRDHLKDMSRIQALTSKIDKRISEIKSSSSSSSSPIDSAKVENFTFEELQDLDKIVGVANFMLCKYSDKKDMRLILKHFNLIISEAADSLGELDDEISELIISAEDSINRVKDIHGRISDGSDFKKRYSDGPDYDAHETCVTNLTNPAIEVNTSQYQENYSDDNK